MTPENTLPANRAVRPGRDIEHFVADLDETPLQVTDKVKDENAPLSLWGEAWRTCAGNPCSWSPRS